MHEGVLKLLSWIKLTWFLQWLPFGPIFDGSIVLIAHFARIIYRGQWQTLFVGKSRPEIYFLALILHSATEENVLEKSGFYLFTAGDPENMPWLFKIYGNWVVFIVFILFQKFVYFFAFKMCPLNHFPLAFQLVKPSDCESVYLTAIRFLWSRFFSIREKGGKVQFWNFLHEEVSYKFWRMRGHFKNLRNKEVNLEICQMKGSILNFAKWGDSFYNLQNKGINFEIYKMRSILKFIESQFWSLHYEEVDFKNQQTEEVNLAVCQIRWSILIFTK